MYDMIKNLIPAGGYRLVEMQDKIKKMYLLGDINETQMDELLSMASAGISSEAERPDYLTMLKGLSDKVALLEARVKTLEIGGGVEETPAQYPQWEAWDGISDQYQQGSVVSHGGVLWISTYVGQNVWEPGAVGTEALWRKYEA